MLMLHENMKNFRKQLRLTQQDIADMLNVDRSTYTAYETKRVPSLDILVKLCKLYRVTLDELAGIVNDFSPPCPGVDINTINGNPDTLDIFDKYLSADERKLLFSIRMLNNNQQAEVKNLIETYSKENSLPE